VEERLRGRSLPVEVHAGRTPEIIHLAHSCIAVSGSVGLELLYHGKPSVVTYREHWSGILFAHMMMQCATSAWSICSRARNFTGVFVVEVRS